MYLIVVMLYIFIFYMKKTLTIKQPSHLSYFLEIFDKENFVIEINCKAVEYQILCE